MVLDILTAYRHRIAELPSTDGLLSELHKVGEHFGATGVFIADLPSPRESLAPFIRLRGWNADWIARYDMLNYVHIDPIAKLLRVAKQPYVWNEICDRRYLTDRERIVMDEARDFGLVNGVTMALRGPHGAITCVSFATDGYSPTEDEQRTLLYLAQETDRRMNELLSGPECPGELLENVPELSPFETDVLNWLQTGAPTKKIAYGVARSQYTVAQTIQSLRMKLCPGARTWSRGLLVSRAIYFGIIRPK